MSRGCHAKSNRLIWLYFCAYSIRLTGVVLTLSFAIARPPLLGSSTARLHTEGTRFWRCSQGSISGPGEPRRPVRASAHNAADDVT
jgi:hypothetical protein